MKKFLQSLKVLLAVLFVVLGSNVSAQSNSIYESYAILSVNGGGNAYYDMGVATPNPDFQGANLGNFNASNSLIVKGGQNKTVKCAGGDTTGGSLYYRVYLTSAGPSGSFTGIGMGFLSNDPGAGSGCQNQAWEGTGGITNIISGLTIPGNYTVEVYSEATGSPSSAYASNGGTNYKATFTYCGPTTGALPVGNYAIPGCFATVASAVSYINTNGVTGTGTVQFDVAAGHTETAPVGGIILLGSGAAGNLATGNATTNIVFKKSGAGTNPTITAPLWVAGGTTDGIIKIVGGDYITFDGFTIQENSANIITATGATNTMSEIGIGLFLASATNGAQNNTIKNCNISLSSSYPNSIGIFSTSSSSLTNGALAASATTGTNSNNKIYSNTISNVAYGFYSICEPITATINESGWDIGGASLSTGNTITFGNASANTSIFTRMSLSTPAGIVMRNGVASNIQFNTVTSNALSYSQTSFGGIVLSSGTAPSGVTFTSNISNNNLTLTNTGTTSITGIDFGYPVATGTIVGSNNAITINQNASAAVSAAVIGIKASYASATNTLNANNIVINQSNSGGATTSAVTGITAAGVGTTVNVGSIGNGNTVTIKQAVSGTGSFGAGAITYINVNAASGTVNVVGNNLNTTGSTIRSTGALIGVFQDATVTTLVNISNNTANIDRVAASGSIIFQSTSGSPSEVKDDIKNNNITFTNLAGTTSATGISSLGGPTAPALNNKTITGNTINISGTNSGTIIGITCAFTNTGIISSNSITLNGAAPTITGITTSGSVMTIASNTLSLTSTTTSPTNASAIIVSGTGAHQISLNSITALSFSSSTATGGTVYGISLTGGSVASIFNNTISGLSNLGTGAAAQTMFGINNTAASTNIYNNNINDLTNSGPSATSLISGIYSGGATPVIYNNFISNLKMPASTSQVGTFGINCAAATTHKIYYNTISLGTSGLPLTGTGANYGVSGVGFLASAVTDLRNNIISVFATPLGTGSATCVSFTPAGVANTISTNFATTSNNNIYTINSGANNYLYAEGTRTATIVNGYALSGLTPSVTSNIVNDPAFNTSCGLYKAKVTPRDQATFSENNLVAGTPVGTFAPSGASYAENGAQAITTPSITTDFAAASRTPTNDIGALQFAGTATDAVAPSITYTAITGSTNTCTAVVSATITDASGVNVTAGTAPRLWYKKSTETNQLLGNTSASNGWKYVESTTGSSPFVFNIDYSLLNSAVVSGDVIQYFVVAQDNSAGANTGTNAATYAAGFCPTSVALSAAAFPTTAVTNSYTITTAATSGTATASVTTICNSGTTSLNITPAGGVLTGLSIQWQSSPSGAGTFTDIAGATTLPYVTASLSTSTDFQCVVKNCAGTTLFTSSIVSVTVNNPTITGVTPAALCGTGTATVSAAGSTGTTVSIFAGPTGGTALATGTTGAGTVSFLTPTISATTTYYAEAGIVGPGSATLGAGLSTSTAAPFNPFSGTYGGEKAQYIIRASELTAAGIVAGNITGLSYFINTVGGTYNGFTIQMGNTALNVMPAIANIQGGLTTVKNSFNTTPTLGANAVVFDTNFNWDGSSNIIVSMSWSNNNASNTNATIIYDSAGFAASQSYRKDNETAANMLSFTGATGAGTFKFDSASLNRPKFTFSAQISSCKTATRTPVAVTVTSPDAVTAYGGGTGTIGGSTTPSATCLGSAVNLYVLKAGTTNTYTYTWSCPTAGNGLSATTGDNISVTPTIAGTYVYTVTATDGSCATTSTVSITVNPVTTITVNPAATTAICVSGNATLNVSATGAGLTYQWQSSATGTLGSFVNVAANDANTGVSYTNAATSALTITGINAPYFYQVVVSSATCPAVTSTTAAITINNPTITSTTPATICGSGTASLQATAGSGTINWYAAATGGSSLGTGSPFVTPTISTTTDYYVGAELPGSSVTLGQIPSVSTCGTVANSTASDWPIRFNTTGSTKLVSFQVIANAGGSVTFNLRNAASSVDILTSTQTLVAGTNTVTVNWPISGSGNYQLTSTTGNLARISTYTCGYPFTSPSGLVSIVASATSSTTATASNSTTSYNCFFSLVFEENCVSSRTKVTATVNTPPSLTLSSSTSTICSGDSTALVTVSTGYDNYIWTPSTGVTGSAATGYTFNPAVTTVYTLNASQSSGSLCNAIPGTFTVNVNPAPAAIAITPIVSPLGASTCNEDYVQLSVLATPSVILSEGFETAVSSIFALTASSVDDFFYSEPYFTEGSTSIGMTSDSFFDGAGNMRITSINSLDLTKYAGLPVVNFTFDHICATEAGFDYGYVEYSTNGGTTWTSFPTTDYTGGATLKNGVVSFDASSYTAWNTQFTSSTSTPGTAPATALFKTETINLAAYTTSNNFKIRFRYKYDSSDDYYGWLIDNVKFNVTPKTTWSPSTGLYTNTSLTTPYIAGTNVLTVYAAPNGSQLYTATATLGTCPKTATSMVDHYNNKFLSVSGNWSLPSNWLQNAVPDLTKCVVISNGQTAIVDTDAAAAKTVTINAGGKLTINAGQALTVKETFTNNAGVNDVIIESDGNLIQKDDVIAVANSGAISAKRVVTIINNNQYNYLISPLIGTNLKTNIYENAGAFTNSAFTLYHNEANNYFNNSSGAYIVGRGLAVKEPTTGSGTINAYFKGVPMNGDFKYPLANSNVGTATNLGYNLTGNPYPSNIDLVQLYKLKSNATNISPTFYFWDNTVNTITAQAGSGYSGAAYAVFNAAAGTLGTGNGAGYLTGTTEAAKKPTYVAKVGQAFMVQSIEKVNKTLYFDNSIRTADAGVGFFGNASKGTVTASADDRFWLNLAAPTSISTQIAVVYFDGGVDAFAKDDSKLNGLPSDVLYSVIGDQKAVINGRASFVNTDSIPLGSNSFTAGTFTFSLGNKEGKFANGQNIYLKDKQTGIVTNLSVGNYTFQANAGESTGRFEIIYQPETVLATDTKVKENLIVYKDGNDFVVKAQNKKISSLEVFDSAGRLIWALKPESIKAIIPAEKIINGLYVLKINQNGEITSKKIIR